jgi:hypothetical protein
MSWKALRPLGRTLAAATALALLAAPAYAADRHVKIINDTGHTIVQFYASNADRDSWEEDILGRETLDPGEEVNINIDDGSGHCVYDFKAVFDDGDVLVRHGINVCTVSSYRYTD